MKKVKSYITCTKDNIKNIVDNPVLEDCFIGYTSKKKKKKSKTVLFEILEDAVIRTNKIMFHVYNFLKIYLLYKYKKSGIGDLEVKLNVQFIRKIINIIAVKSEKRGKKITKDKETKDMTTFYKEKYKPFLNDSDYLNKDSLNYILNYEATAVITNITTNIKKHYVSHLRTYIWIKFGFRDKIRKIDSLTYKTAGIEKNCKDKEQRLKSIKREKKKILNKIFNTIMDDIVYVREPSNFVSLEKYHTDIEISIGDFVPSKRFYKRDDNGNTNIAWDIQENPLDYLNKMITLNLAFEELNQSIIDSHNDPNTHPPIIKTFNALPLKTSLIPSYITIDTAGLISLFTKKDKKQHLKNLADKKTKEKLWGRIFDLDVKSFSRKGYTFHYMLKTDGVGVSILMIKTDKKGNPIKEPSKKDLREERKEIYDTPYINDIQMTKELLKRNIVAADPGDGDLLTFAKEIPKEKCLTTFEKKFHIGEEKKYANHVHYSYTQGQRNHDIRKNKYIEIREDLKDLKIDKTSIRKIESPLCEYDSKTCNYEKFKSYLGEKISISRKLWDHYKEYIYRKLKLNTYINTKRSESNMINKFKSKMGNPEDILLVIGDYSRGQGVRGRAPSKGKSFRKLFRDNDYKVCLIDEYNTSALCSHCHSKNEHFLEVERNGKKIKLWKLLKCTNCKVIHNRDHNAAKNMLTLSKLIMAKKSLPKPFQR